MTELLKAGEAKNAETMTSLQIAEITGKRHDHVLRDIRNMEEALNKTLTPDVGAGYERANHAMRGYLFNDDTYTDKSGKLNVMLVLNKKSALLLASGYDVALRAKIIDRWEELENANKPCIPQTFAEALMLAAQQAQQIEEQQKQLEEQAPKVEFFNAVADSKTAVAMNEVAKVLAIKGYGRNNLFEFLRQQKVLMRNNRPYATYIDRGYFRVIEQRYQQKGEECISFKTLVYQRGIEFIRKLIQNKTCN